MEKTNKNKRGVSTKSLVFFFVILLVAILALVLLKYYHTHPSTKTALGGPKVSSSLKSTHTSSSMPNDNVINNERKASPSPASTLNNGPTAIHNQDFTAEIVSQNIANGNLHIGTLVGGVTTGTCTLTAIKSGQQTITLANTNVRQDVNNYDCGAINVTTKTFPASGVWKLALTVTDNNQQASGSTDVTIPSGS